MPSKATLRRLIRERIAATIPEGSGAEIKNLCEALYTLEGKGEGKARSAETSPRRLTVRFEGAAEDYSL